KILKNYGPLGQYYKQGHGYFFFPKLEGRISNKMMFRGKEHLCWSLNNYIGLADHPEVRKTDAEAAAQWGFGSPMGARMMSGQTDYHEQLERDLASFVKKESAYLLNFGYPGMVSIIDALVDRHDAIVYDSEAHACIIDGLRMTLAKRFVYPHSNMEALEKNLERATKLVEKTGGSILVITEGVYGMVGDIAKLDQIVAMKKKFQFRLLVDDAHGFGTMGPTGAGTDEHLGVQDGVDLYFATFAKAMAMIGGFVASKKEVIDYLHYNMRSQVYAKSMPMPLVIGAMKRLELLKNSPELREKLWTIVHALRDGLRAVGFDMGVAESPVTPVFLKGSLPETTQLIHDLRENYRIFCNVVIYPVVPKGVIMIRLIPTATHTMEDVKYTIDCFSQVAEKLKNGSYSTTEYADISEK
ncbi:MAG: aminotransferase class I/II-fold pyridoxal phosphate-dependent enzyme, partial [Bacteroidota bacterium]